MNRILDLTNELIYQYPTGITTHGPCANGCGNMARGGGVCKACVQQEMLALGVSKRKVSALVEALVTVQDLDDDDILRDARLAVMDAKADITSEMV
jgi:hypothetical protein